GPVRPSRGVCVRSRPERGLATRPGWGGGRATAPDWGLRTSAPPGPARRRSTGSAHCAMTHPCYLRSDMTAAAPPRVEYGHVEPVTVFFDDLDALGFVHNARYPILLERALTTYWAERGYSYDDGRPS